MEQPAGQLSRREVIQRVTALLGGAALAGGDRLFAFTFETEARANAMSQGAGAFSAADIALLDEIADTILPETSTPGAKAAKTGAFMALMVTAAYSERNQRVFREGMRQVDDACRAAHGAGFMAATTAQRLSLLETLDREQREVSALRANPGRARVTADGLPSIDDDDLPPQHYFRLMKELALQGYFTSEIGYTRAMRYVEAPGRFDPDVPHVAGDKTWAPHA